MNDSDTSGSMGDGGALLMPEVAGVAAASSSCGLEICGRDNEFCVHSVIDAAGPPTMVTACNSSSLPSTVP